MEFQLSYFKSWKMMLWKCCTQYASKSGKLSTGHKTGKGQFSFQSQRKAMPKNAKTTLQLHSSHTLAKQCSKFSKPGFNSTWMVNFQMFKLDLEKEEFGLCGRRRGWHVSREQYQNMYIIYSETDYQPRLDAWDKCLGLVHWEDSEGLSREGCVRGDREGEYL